MSYCARTCALFQCPQTTGVLCCGLGLMRAFHLGLMRAFQLTCGLGLMRAFQLTSFALGDTCPRYWDMLSDVAGSSSSSRSLSLSSVARAGTYGLVMGEEELLGCFGV
eukprot:355635-Chlamydomonas_euryale.AAC.9